MIKYMLPWTPQLHIPNNIPTGSAVFAQLTIVTDRLTDSQTMLLGTQYCDAAQ